MDAGDYGSGGNTSTDSASKLKCKSIASFFGGGSTEAVVVNHADLARGSTRKRQREDTGGSEGLFSMPHLYLTPLKSM